MELAGKAEERAAGSSNRRTAPRYGLDEEARVFLVRQGVTVSCRVIDLSLKGCRVRTQDRFAAGASVRVEIALRVRGFSFRFSGVIQWTDGRRLAGIRFVDVPPRRRDELAEALGEVEEKNAAKSAGQAEEQASPKGNVIPIRPVQLQGGPGVQARSSEPQQSPLQAIAVRPGPLPAGLTKEEAQPVAVPAAKSANSDRRAQSRHAVDTSAVVFLINVASRIQGRILDLSLSGCRIRTDERFPVGIYTRIEVEFRLEGLPFRLGGVIQAIHDRHHVGIRLLDMSSRKREQLEQLIEEIKELREKEEADGRDQGLGTRD
ncbi:MAG: PilZ domain-containing protein [Terracidiphilus sp.]|jgi:hypothetical protein